ncbi:Uncharacterised protein [Legionella wadsworthii]|uniref:Uncharacterized protein n=1 Tax=Legionella wadsworthii TaxID=28088 RepID=A0A378P314_9GAMM|nr:hypothetical protein [Legionella wadsworthii]STY78970.1 Uncharacterised protein [Legionella wadsworthii]
MVLSNVVAKPIILLLMCISFLVSSCVSFTPQDDAKNNIQLRDNLVDIILLGMGMGMGMDIIRAHK